MDLLSFRPYCKELIIIMNRIYYKVSEERNKLDKCLYYYIYYIMVEFDSVYRQFIDNNQFVLITWICYHSGNIITGTIS